MQKSLAEICTNPGEIYKNPCDWPKIKMRMFFLSLVIIVIINTSTNKIIILIIANTTTTIIIICIIIISVTFLAGK